MEISQEEKEYLLNLARQSISSLFSKEDHEIKPDYEKFPVLKSHSGAFVTLTKKGRLRGCIGYIESSKPLFETIKDAAQSAAFNDPRFNPLESKEIDEIDLEISILSETVSHEKL